MLCADKHKEDFWVRHLVQNIPIVLLVPLSRSMCTHSLQEPIEPHCTLA